MRNNDYYQVLGLNPTCTPHDIKKSYRQLALIWHPDKNHNKKEAQVQFMSINEAYNILIDTTKREIYDTYGHEGLNLAQEDNTKARNKNNFFEKGFFGADKSAFDVMKGIFEDNDDDDFFKGFDLSGMCNKMKANIEAFVYENIISSEDEESDFFTDYMPTFMNTTFTSSFSSLHKLYPGEGNPAQFFSSIFSDSSDNELNADKRNSANKNSKKSKDTKVKLTRGDGNEKMSPKPSNPSNKRKAKTSKCSKNSKKSFLVNDETEVFEEELHIEFNVINQKRKLSYSIEILEGTDHDIPLRKNQLKKSAGKNEGEKRLIHDGKKKIKK